MRNRFGFKRPFISIKHAQWLHRKNLWINSSLRCVEEIFLPSRVEIELKCLHFPTRNSFVASQHLRFLDSRWARQFSIVFHFLVRISCVCDFWLGKLIRQAHLFHTVRIVREFNADYSGFVVYSFPFYHLSLVTEIILHADKSLFCEKIVRRSVLLLHNVGFWGLFLCLLTWMTSEKCNFLSFPACCFFQLRCPQI